MFCIVLCLYVYISWHIQMALFSCVLSDLWFCFAPPVNDPVDCRNLASVAAGLKLKFQPNCLKIFIPAADRALWLACRMIISGTGTFLTLDWGTHPSSQLEFRQGVLGETHSFHLPQSFAVCWCSSTHHSRCLDITCVSSDFSINSRVAWSASCVPEDLWR